METERVNPKISVVVPVYNVEKSLEKCIDSLLVQKYADFEIILIDDGSTDSSSYICDLYAKKNDRIKVLHKKNAGLGYARNSGIEIASGKYIVFLDSDDYFSDTLLSNLVEVQVKNNCDTVVAGYIRVSENGECLGELKYSNVTYKDEAILNKLICRMMGSEPNKRDAIDMGATHVLYSLDIIKKNKIEFPSERELISEDAIFNLRYYPYAKKVSLIDKCDYYYVATMGSITKKYRADRFDAVKKLYNEECNLLNKINLLDQAQIRLMKTFFNNVKMCLAQEKRKVSKKSVIMQIKNIEKICNDPLVKKIIKEYPVTKLGIQQKVFVYLLKFRCKVILTLFVECGYINV